MKSFEDHVLSGHLNQRANEALADAIAKTNARGLPVEVYANTDPRSTQVSSSEAKKKSMP